MSIKKNKVLIVEDELLMQLVEERFIKCLGYTVAGRAADGVHALTKVKELRPDIMVMDINLKGDMDGIQVAEKLKSDGYDIPIIFLTGEKNDNVFHNARDKGCIDYLIKPITIDVLKKSLDKAIEYNKTVTYTAA